MEGDWREKVLSLDVEETRILAICDFYPTWQTLNKDMMILGIIYIKQARKLLVQLFASEQSDYYESVLLANILSNTAKIQDNQNVGSMRQFTWGK